eukprot:231196-Amphidinium_carterae.2
MAPWNTHWIQLRRSVLLHCPCPTTLCSVQPWQTRENTDVMEGLDATVIMCNAVLGVTCRGLFANAALRQATPPVGEMCTGMSGAGPGMMGGLRPAGRFKRPSLNQS